MYLVFKVHTVAARAPESCAGTTTCVPVHDIPPPPTIRTYFAQIRVGGCMLHPNVDRTSPLQGKADFSFQFSLPSFFLSMATLPTWLLTQLGGVFQDLRKYASMDSGETFRFVVDSYRHMGIVDRNTNAAPGCRRRPPRQRLHQCLAAAHLPFASLIYS